MPAEVLLSEAAWPLCLHANNAHVGIKPKHPAAAGNLQVQQLEARQQSSAAQAQAECEANIIAAAEALSKRLHGVNSKTPAMARHHSSNGIVAATR